MAQEEFKSYKPIHTTEEVIALTQSALGNQVNALERKDLGEINAVYFAEMEDGEECVIRISPKERNFNTFGNEAWAFKKASEQGVPTPEVLVMDVSLSRFPEAFMITKRIEGVDGDRGWSSEEERLSLIRQLGHYLSLIHKVKVKRFARHPELQRGDLVGKYVSQWESIKADLDAPWREEKLVGMGLLSKEKFDKYMRMFEENRELFDIPEASLVHGDISLKNSIVKDGKVVGVLDFENCMAGDPIQDFAWFHFWTDGTEPYFSVLKEGYVDKDLFDQNFLKKMYFYQLYLGQSLLGYYHSRNNQEWVEQVQKKLPEIEQKIEDLL